MRLMMDCWCVRSIFVRARIQCGVRERTSLLTTPTRSTSHLGAGARLMGMTAGEKWRRVGLETWRERPDGDKPTDGGVKEERRIPNIVIFINNITIYSGSFAKYNLK